MELSGYEIALIGVAGTIAGTLVGALVGYYLSKALAKETEKRHAIIKLRDAFKFELLALNPSQSIIDEELPKFLETKFEKHRNAIYDFSHYLSTKNKALFYKAWYEYYCHEDLRNENGVPFFEQYSCQGLTIEKEHQMKNLVKKRIESILEFAK